MSKRRKAETEENKFAALLRTFRAETDDLATPEDDDSDGDRRAIGDDAIDVEAEVVVDPNALPAAETLALPAGSGAAVFDPPPTVIEAVAAETIETAAIEAKTIEAETIEAEAETVESAPKGKVGRPRRLNAKPKNTNNGKRGRPATGKRSNRDWHGRTYYLQKQTDIILEDALFKLKRSGVEIDRSDLVDALLSAWAGVTMGKISDFQIGEIVKKQIRKGMENEE
jgi:hypothetical protein